MRAAEEKDNKQLCQLAGSHIMPGDIKVIYAREPNYFFGLNIQGKYNQVCLYEENDNIVAYGCRSIKPVYINGQATDIGYLSGLRAVKRKRGGITLPIFQKLKEMHSQQWAPIYLNTIVDNNKAAINALTKNRPGIPRYFDFGAYHTHVISLGQHPKKNMAKTNITVRKGQRDEIIAIVSFLNRVGRNKQFFPVYTPDDFCGEYTRDFSINDFYVAEIDGCIKGIIGKWDQGSYKQAIIVGPEGTKQPLKMFYCSFLCVENDNMDVMKTLIQAIFNEYSTSDYLYFTIGFHDKDRLKDAIKNFESIHYISRLFIVAWEDGIEYFNTLRRDMVPYLETGTL